MLVGSVVVLVGAGRGAVELTGCENGANQDPEVIQERPKRTPWGPTWPKRGEPKPKKDPSSDAESQQNSSNVDPPGVT